jgi:hypothetical protein
LAVVSEARADRAPSPTDALGDWAIESSLRFGFHEEDRLVETRFGPEVVPVGRSRMVLSSRVWPVQGGFVRIEQAVDRITEDALEDVAADDARERSVADLLVGLGYRARLTPSLVLGGGLDMTAPTGNGLSTSDRLDLDADLLLGFSFSPSWEVYARPLFGVRTGDEDDPRVGTWLGWSAGTAVALARFFLVAYGFNRHHFENRRYISTGGGAELGYELSPGWTLSFGFRAEGSETFASPPDQAERLLDLGLQLTVVYYPTATHNEYRKPDQKRGLDWQWWRGRPPRN